MAENTTREGSLEAPTRHAIDWRNPDFYNSDSLFAELERVYDICHGCRRCFSLCHSFPTLFNLIDATDSGELADVNKADYWKVVDHCYLCDMCYMTKCPYVPPHPWNVDFPHLMLRGKAVKFKQNPPSLRDKVLTSTDLLGKLAGIPVVSQTVNTVNRNPALRKLMQNAIGVHAEAELPDFATRTLQQRQGKHRPLAVQAQATAETRGKVALFGTCYGNNNEPQLGDDIVAIFEHNGIPVTLARDTQCCGMPKLELGDLETVEKFKNNNMAVLARLVDEGWDIVAPVPSCVFMFKSELPLIFPEESAGKESGRRHVRSVRISLAAAQGRPVAHRFQELAGHGRPSSSLPSAVAEYRQQDPRCAGAGARHQGAGDRALRRA